MYPATYISGATGFAGYKLAEHLALQGKNLLLSARDGNRLKEIVECLSKRYPNQDFAFFTCDLAIPETWNGAVEVLKDFQINQYLNCSGTHGVLGPSSELGYEAILSVFNVNLFSSIFFTTFLSKQLREGDDLSIIHFSGGGSTGPRPHFMAYSLSKTALLRFIENFAAENLNTNIKINAIAPGVMPSKMLREVVGHQQFLGQNAQIDAIKSISTGNFDFARIFNLCDFLLSRVSDGITGKLISSEWDNWAAWPNHIPEIRNSDLYTLRRITGRDRGLEWSDL